MRAGAGTATRVRGGGDGAAWTGAQAGQLEIAGAWWKRHNAAQMRAQGVARAEEDWARSGDTPAPKAACG